MMKDKELVLHKLKEFRKKRLSFISFKLTSYFLLYLAVFFWFYLWGDLIFNFSIPVIEFFRVIFYISTALFFLFLLFLWISPLRPQKEADYLERELQDKQNLFSNYFDFKKQIENSEKQFSSYLLAKFLDHVPERVKEYDFQNLYPLRPLKKVWIMILFLVFSLLFVFINYQKEMTFSLVRLFSDRVNYVKINVDYPQVACLGDDITLKISFLGKIYTQPKIIIEKLNSAKKEIFPLELHLKGDALRGKFLLHNLQEDFVFRFYCNRKLYGNYKVKVLDLPRVEKVKVVYSYPKYTGIKKEYIEENPSRIYALLGSSIEVNFFLNRPFSKYNLSSKGIYIKNKKEFSREVYCSFQLDEEGELKFSFIDRYGFSMDSPYVLKLQPLEDKPPQVRILSPGKDIDFPANNKVVLEINADDDFGFSKVDFVFLLSGEEKRIHLLSTTTTATNFYKKMDWALSKSMAESGEDIVYWIEVWDNDQLMGPKKASSKVYKIKVRTALEKDTDFVGKLNESIEELEKNKQEQKDILKEARKILKKKQVNRKLTFKDRKRLEQLKKRQQQLRKKTAEVMKKFNQEVKKMKKNKLMDPELMEKIAKLQELFREIVDRKMLERLKNMDSLLHKVKLTPQDMEKFKYKFDSRRIKEDLERMIKLMRRIRDEKELSSLAKAARRLQSEQRKINKKLEEINKNGAKNREELSKLALKQKQLQKQLKLLQKAMQQLARSLPYQEKKLKDKLLSTLQQMQKQKLSQKMVENSKKISSGETQKAQKQGENLEKQLQKLAQNLAASQKMMNQMRGQENLKGVDYILSLLFLFSFREEELSNQIDTDYYIKNNRGEIVRYRFDNYALSYYQLRDRFAFVKERLDDLAGKTFLLGAKLLRAAKLIKSDFNAAGTVLEKENLTLYRFQSSLLRRQINQLIFALLRMRQKMKSSGSGSGAEQLMQMLNQMISQQKKMMQQTQQLLKKYGGFNKLPQQIQDMLKQMAYRQMMMRQAMEQMMRKMGKLSDYYDQLNQMVKEMKDIEKSLRGGKLGAKLVRKQKKLLEKMLETRQSIYRKKFSKKRYAKKGRLSKKGLRDGKLKLSEREKKQTEYKIKPLHGDSVPLLPGYEKYINQYFKSINKAIEGE